MEGIMRISWNIVPTFRSEESKFDRIGWTLSCTKLQNNLEDLHWYSISSFKYESPHSWEIHQRYKGTGRSTTIFSSPGDTSLHTICPYISAKPPGMNVCHQYRNSWDRRSFLYASRCRQEHHQPLIWLYQTVTKFSSFKNQNAHYKVHLEWYYLKANKSFSTKTAYSLNIASLQLSQRCSKWRALQLVTLRK